MGGYVAVGLQVAQMAEQQRQAKAAANAQAQQQAAQSQLLWQQQEQRAKQQRDLLKRQVATARASLAGGGMGIAGGSGEALMAGLVRRTEEDISDGASAASLRHEAQFGGERVRPNRLLQGIEDARKGYSLLKPLFD